MCDLLLHKLSSVLVKVPCAVTAFGGGIWAAQKIGDLHLPQVSRAVDEGTTFKLYVRVLSAAIPSLSDPGNHSTSKASLAIGSIPVGS